MTIAVSTTQALVAVGLWLCVVVPGVVTALKGQWLLLAVGLLVGGIVWLIVALRLARPNSFWARRFYGKEKRRRSQARYGSAEPQGENLGKSP
jgi:hypothetical protein